MKKQVITQKELKEVQIPQGVNLTHYKELKELRGDIEKLKGLKDLKVAEITFTNKLKDLTAFFDNKNAAEKIKLYKFQVQFDYAEFFYNLYYKLTEWLCDNDKYLAERDEYINNNIIPSQITTQTCYKFNDVIYIDSNLTKPIQLYDIIKTPISAMFYSPKGRAKEYVIHQKQIIEAFYSSMDQMLLAAKEYKREGKNRWF